MVVAGLVLGIIGTSAGLGALVWHLITWQLSGPVVKVDATQGYLTQGPELSDEITIVTATNSARAPVTVNSWGRSGHSEHCRHRPGRAMFSQGTVRLQGAETYPRHPARQISVEAGRESCP